jgi:hypothetical protein
MQPYIRVSAGRPERALRLYAWNIEVSAAFWGPLGILEVVTRNAIHDAMREGRRDDWWNDPQVRLMDRERTAIDLALAALARRGVRSPTADQVVAATSLGFWVGLTDSGIPRDPYLSYETALWQPRIGRAFPCAGFVRRKEIHRELDDVRLFRNRVAHHEPVHAASLARMRERIIRLAGWVHPDAALLIGGMDRVTEVLARRRVAVDLGECVI